MIRPVSAEEADLDAEVSDGVRIRRVERQGTGMPSEEDLRTVHDILEESFADHFNSHEESFDEFVFRLRSEEHTSELQSPVHLVCRLLLEKKKKKKKYN